MPRTKKVEKPPSSRPLSESASTARDRLRMMTEGARSLGTRPASDLIREVEGVPTIFPIVDHRVGVRGFPISRLSTVQGPSNEGKSTYVLGLIRSFLENCHYARLVDAERSTPKTYARTMVGELFDSPLFSVPERIGGYENVTADILRWCEGIGELREKKRIPEDATGLVVVDSLANMIPTDLLAEMSKAEKADKAEGKGFKFKKKRGHVDGAGGRAGQIIAGFNTAWFRQLSSLLPDTRTALIAIVREKEEEGEGFRALSIFEPVGGREVKYGPHLRMRVSARPIHEGEGKEKIFVGEKHLVTIEKTKLAGKEEKVPHAWFCTSNGATSPEGFDRDRDVLDLAIELSVIEQAGSWYSFAGERLGQGTGQALVRLRERSDLLDSIERSCRERF